MTEEQQLLFEIITADMEHTLHLDFHSARRYCHEYSKMFMKKSWGASLTHISLDSMQEIKEDVTKRGLERIALIQRVLKLCSKNDADELAKGYCIIGDTYDVMSMMELSLDGLNEKKYEYINEAIEWFKRASLVLMCNSEYKRWAVWQLASSVVVDDWCPSPKDRDVQIIFQNALVDPALDSHTRQWVLAASAKCYQINDDLIKAKEFYEEAKRIGAECKEGLDCESELEAIDLALGVANAKTNAMQRFIHRITFCSDLAGSVTRKLKNTFGNTWGKLQKSTKECLTTGFLTYILLYKNFYAEGHTDMDYSSVIIPVMKALEIEFSRIFFECFLTWLKANDIPPDRFYPEKCELVEYRVKPGDYEYVETKQGYDYYRLKETDKQIQYVANDKKGVFGIGKLKYWVLDYNWDSFNRSPSVNPVFVDFFNEIFLPEAFKTSSRKTMIETYLLELTQKLSYLAGRVRNPAAHSDTMPFWKANYCCNVVVMVDRVLQNFIAKIKPEYLRSGEVMPKSSKKTPDRTT